MDRIRYNRWVRASSVLRGIEPKLIDTVKGLGKLDAELFEKNIKFKKVYSNPNSTVEEWVEVGESLFTAYLWVIGSYEVIRTLNKRLKLQHHHKEISSQKVKHTFERVRIPLAKLERARNHPNDCEFAYPALSSQGIGWQVSSNAIIPRDELSSLLLDFMESLNIPANI